MKIIRIINYILLLFFVLMIAFFINYHINQRQNSLRNIDYCSVFQIDDIDDIIEKYLDGDISNREARIVMYENDTLILKCPFCGHDVIPIRYGFLPYDKEVALLRDSLAYDLSGRERVYFAGCVSYDSNWVCVKCKRRFKYYERLYLDQFYERKRIPERFGKI